MADLTARFGADFSEFHSAVQQAEAELKGFDAGATSVQASLNRMTDQFSGRQLIQQAEIMTKAIEEIGGASKLTEAELARVGNTVGDAVAKMDKIGIDVPDRMRSLANETKGAGQEVNVLSGYVSQLGGMIAGAFTLQSIIQFGKSIVDFAGNIEKTAIQTGMMVDEVQKLQYIADQTSVNFGSLTSAAQGLQDAIGSNNTGVNKAIEDLGINLSAFKALGTYDQILAISDALRGIEDPTKRARLEADLFGGKWKEITPAVLANMRELGKEVSLLSKAEIDAIGEFEKAWKGFVTEFQVGGGKVAAVVGTLNEKFHLYRIATAVATGGMSELDDLWELLSAKLGKGSTEATEAASGVAAIGTAARDATPPLEQFGNKGGELAEKMRAAGLARHKKEIDDINDAAKKAADELASWAAKYDEVNAAGTDFDAVLAGIDEQLLEHIQRLLDAGDSAESLADVYELPIGAVKRLDENTKNYNATIAESERLSTHLASLIAENQGSALEASIAAINREAELYKQHQINKGQWSEELAAKLDAIRQQEIIKETVDFGVLKDAAGSTFTDIATRARATYEFMNLHSEKYATADIIRQEQVAIAAETAADRWSTSMIDAGKAVGDAGDEAADRHKRASAQVALSWSQAMDAVRAGQGSMSTSGAPASANEIRDSAQKGRYYGPVDAFGNPDYGALGLGQPSAASGWSAGATQWGHRAAGGPVSSGSPYMVGERGPELFVPGSGGSIVPNGGGSSVVANIYVNGTGHDVARVINAELTRMMRVGRKWPSV